MLLTKTVNLRSNKVVLSEKNIEYDDNIDLFKCIIGINGAGKTELLNTYFTNAYKDNIDIIKYSNALEFNQNRKKRKKQENDNSNKIDLTSNKYLQSNNINEMNREYSIFQIMVSAQEYELLKKSDETGIINFEHKKVFLDLSDFGEAVLLLQDKYFSNNSNDEIKSSLKKLIINKQAKVILKTFFSIIDEYLPKNDKNEKIENIITSIDENKINTYEYTQNKEINKEINDFLEAYIFYKENFSNKGNSLDNAIELNNKDNHKTIIEMCQHINKPGITSDAFRSISFYWNSLSSGELSILNLLGRLHSYKEENKDPKDTILLIDEVDLGLHPEWQRVWVKRVLPIIGKILKKEKDKTRLEVIITTHSPIILSDLANDDIIYLNNNGMDKSCNNEKTLGQNIYKLFLNSFYLDNTQGEFSIYFIEKIIKELNEIETSIKELNETETSIKELKERIEAIGKNIELIGENIIRNALEEKIEEIREELEEIREELEEIIKNHK